MTISFDEIHTRKKQQLLAEMMEKTARSLLHLDNPNPKLSRCPLCDSGEVGFYVQAFGFDMFRCTACGLLFCNPYPSSEQLHRYYNSEMKAFENEFFRESFENRIRLFQPRLEIIRKFKSAGKLLDIGAAIGIFAETLARSDTNFTVTCCDLSTEACRELGVRFPQFEVVNADVLTLDEHETYDVITLWDTIEHIVDLHPLLDKIHRLLKDDGILVFTTPNTDSFEWDCAGNRHVQILPPGHVNLLNEKAIRLLLGKNGFSLVDAYTLNASLDISYVKKLLGNGQADSARIGVFLEKALHDPEFEGILTDYLIRKRKAGNIMVVAGKSSANQSDSLSQ